MGKYEHLNTAEDIYDHLLSVAVAALKKKGVSALEYLYSNPNLSQLQLANQLEATLAGLRIAFFREAVSKGLVRQIAKELLFRKIVEEYPEGWTSFDEIGPIVNLVSWVTTFKLSVNTSREVDAANRIYTDIARDTLPPEGWKPESADDPFLVELFDRNWPIND